jgi:hypothetical protein
MNAKTGLTADALTQRIAQTLANKIEVDVATARQQFIATAMGRGSCIFENITVTESNRFPQRWNASTHLDAVCAAIRTRRLEAELPGAVEAFLKRVEGMLP